MHRTTRRLALFFSPILSAITTPLAAGDLDPLTAELICALFLIAGAALISAMVSRQRFGAVLGAEITYSLGSVLPFLHQELSPHNGPGGHLEAFHAGALAHTIAVLLASGLLCAYLGAAIGSALGEVLLGPLWHLAQLIWHARPRSKQAKKPSVAGEQARHRSAWQLFLAWADLFTLLLLVFLSSGIGDLLLYSPDVGVHTSSAVARRGTLIAQSMLSPLAGGILHSRREHLGTE